MRSWFVSIAATHRTSAGRAMAAMASSRLEATRANEAMIRAVVVFVGRAV